MQAKHAATILKLIGYMTLNDLREQGALEAVIALQEHAARPDSIYIIVPYSGGGTAMKVEAIKTIRQISGYGLKEAKDAFDEAWPSGRSIRNGAATRIGPFNFGISFEEVQHRAGKYAGMLEVEIG
jgi:ribosomal protein L7/L12